MCLIITANAAAIHAQAKKHVPFKYTHAAPAPLADRGAQPTRTAAPGLEIRARWAPGPSGPSREEGRARAPWGWSGRGRLGPGPLTLHPHEEDASEIDQGGIAKGEASGWLWSISPGEEVDMASDSPARSLDEIDLSALRVSRACFLISFQWFGSG